MPSQQEKIARFAELHHGDGPLVLANPWDPGSARALVAIGYDALATTSSGSAGATGRFDGAVTREEAIEYARAIADAVEVPVSADLENGFGDAAEAAAETIGLAIDAGLAGGSIEDWSRDRAEIYDLDTARARVEAAAETAHGRDPQWVLTARAENHLHGRTDLADTIARLQAYQAAGADVLYAPGITAPDDIATLVAAVDRPVNVLALPGVPSVPELAAIGVRRVSIGGAFSYVALAALERAARELLDHGTYGFAPEVAAGRKLATQAYR